MKKIILITVLLFGGFLTSQAQEETFDITVNISGLKSNEGNVLIALYKGSENFLKKSYVGVIAKIADKKSTYILKNIPKGEYAISFFHDENDNKKMDSNFLGIPKEDYGCSNNATGFMGPPKYNDAKFTLSKNTTVNIEI